MDSTARVTARQIIESLDRTGADVPAEVAAAWHKTRRLVDATGDIAPAPDALAVAVANAVEHGTDPATDAEVQRTLAASQIANPGLAAGVPRDRIRPFPNRVP